MKRVKRTTTGESTATHAVATASPKRTTFWIWNHWTNLRMFDAKIQPRETPRRRLERNANSCQTWVTKYEADVVINGRSTG